MLRRLASLDARQRKLLALGLGWVIAARVALRLGDRTFPERQRLLHALAANLPKLAPGCTAAEAAWAITAAASRVPGTRCLAWALALRGLMAQAGIAAELRIGVAPSQTDRFAAHAWVESAGRDWSWGAAAGDFSVLRPRPAGP